MSLVHIENLKIDIGETQILRDIDLTIDAGEVVGLVGESGSGKSMTALALMQLLPRTAETSGKVSFNGIDILNASEETMCALRGDDLKSIYLKFLLSNN